MATTNIFEYATRHKLRFATSRGGAHLGAALGRTPALQGRLQPQLVAKAAQQAWKDVAEESFVETPKTDAHARTRDGPGRGQVRHRHEDRTRRTRAKTRANNKLEKEKLRAHFGREAGRQAERTVGEGDSSAGSRARASSPLGGSGTNE